MTIASSGSTALPEHAVPAPARAHRARGDRWVILIRSDLLPVRTAVGDLNQVALVKKLVPTVDGPVLEIGSKDHGSTSTFRDFYAGNDYVGIDAEDGPGVDIVCDLTDDAGPVPVDHFALCICTSVLEHVRKPWIAAATIERFLRKGGILFVSVPWVWRYHPYPDDYFRFSASGIKALFERIDFTGQFYSTNLPGEVVNMAQATPQFDNSLACHKDTNHGPRKYLPYLMVNLVGARI